MTSKRSKPQPPHTRGTFHRRQQPLYTEKYKVSCSGFLHKTKPMQHSCNHYIGFCSMTWLTRISLRTWQHQMTTIMHPFQCDLQPQIQETHRTTGTTTRCRTQRRNRLTSKRSKPHLPHTGGTFHRRLQPLYTEKYKMQPTNPNAHTYVHMSRHMELHCFKISIVNYGMWNVEHGVCTKWYCPYSILFSLRDVITSVAMQRRTAIITFQSSDSEICICSVTNCVCRSKS